MNMTVKGFLRKKKIRAAGCILLAVFLWGCGDNVQTVNSEGIQPDKEQAAESTKDEAGDGEDFYVEAEPERTVVEEDKPEEDIQITEIPERPKVKGIFVTGPMAGTSNMENLITLVDETELNTIVMDIKNDEGRIVYDMQIPSVLETGAGVRYVQDMESLIKKCKDKNIYLIARIVAFKDPFLADVRPEWCIHNPDGSVFRDKGGLAWINPYNREVWDYLLDIAEEALRMGFDEIQFDYIRFSTDSGMKNVDFGQPQEEDRQKIITDFVIYASDRIHKAGGAVSADVYGMVIDSEVDQKIVGQNYVDLSRYLDYISPMVYPSHYGPFNYNIPIPDAEPYRLVLTALQSSRRVLAGIPAVTVSGNMGNEYTAEELAVLSPMEGIKAQVRPWLQDFTATWVEGHIPYGPDEIRAQIQAVYDAGYEEWILWNASNRYTEGGLLKED